MSNRRYDQFHLSLEKQPVMLWLKAAIGAVGAPTLSVAASKGVLSIARTGVGAYTITLSDPYMKLLMIQETRLLAAGAPAANGGMILRAVNVPGSSVDVAFVDGSGAAAEISSGATLYMKLELGRSTV